jgi:cell division protein FtsX
LLGSVDDLIQGLGEFLPQLSALIWFLIATFAIVFSYLAVYWGYWWSVTKLGKHFLSDQGSTHPSVQ